LGALGALALRGQARAWPDVMGARTSHPFGTLAPDLRGYTPLGNAEFWAGSAMMGSCCIARPPLVCTSAQGKAIGARHFLKKGDRVRPHARARKG